MDSLTQMTLGAAVSGAVMGRQAGWKAFAWGAAVGTLPDLDVLVPLDGPVATFTYHRGVSHAFFFQTLAAPLIAWGIHRVHGGEAGTYRGWLVAVWLNLVTHALLDSFTIYGTQILQPFSGYPVGLGSIFIIDPLYTLPLAVGVAVALSRRRRWRRARLWNAAGLVLSGLYLAWTAAAQQQVEAVGHVALEAQGIPHERMLATPTPLNTVVWRILAVGDGAYYEGYYRIGGGRSVSFRRHESRPELLAPVKDEWAVRRLQYFTKGFYSVTREGEQVVMTDLRMGQHPYYAFSFRIGRAGNGTVEGVADARLDSRRPPLSVVLQEVYACVIGARATLIPC